MGTADKDGQPMPATTWGRAAHVIEVLRILLLGSVLLGAVPMAALTDGWAQTTSPGPAVKLESGEVTGTGAKSIQVNGKDYLLDPAIIIKDSSGKARELKDIARGDFVQFHLKRERIDQLVLVLPS